MVNFVCLRVHHVIAEILKNLKNFKISKIERQLRQVGGLNVICHENVILLTYSYSHEINL